MKVKQFITIIITIASITFGLTFCHRFKHLPPEQRANKLVEYLKEELNLTNQQYQELQSIKTKIMARHKEIQKPPFWFNDDFLIQLEKGDIEKDKIKKEIKEFHEKLLENRLKDIDEIYPFISNLSQEQRSKLAKLIKEHKKDFKKHHKFY
jgi:predicted transcriptional regulator